MPVEISPGLFADTVGDILARDPVWPGEGVPDAPVAELALPTLDGAAEWPGERVVFGMSDEEYHAIPALSASGIKLMRQTPLDFWARMRWLNPDYEEGEGDTIARMIGSAFHKRILEGSAAFYASYAPMLDKRDAEGLLVTTDEIKAAIEAVGEKPVSRIPTGAVNIVEVKGANVEKPVTRAAKKDDWIAQLLALDPDAQIWDSLVAANAELHAGKLLLMPQTIARIELAAAMIERHPDISRSFAKGYPEVAVLWVCPKHGLRMKAKFDYLKLKAITDLKTLANARGMPFDRAAMMAIAQYGYHIQFALYLDAAENAKRIAKAGAIHGDHDPEWVAKWIAAPDPVFSFVMQQSGVAPVARMYIMQRSGVYAVARAQIDEAKRKFRECVETFGCDPWVDMTGAIELEDHQFPAYLSE